MAFLYRFVGDVFSASASWLRASGDDDVDWGKRKQSYLVEILRQVSVFRSAEQNKDYDTQAFADAIKTVYETHMMIENAPTPHRERLRTEFVGVVLDAKVDTLFISIFEDCVARGLPTRFYSGEKPQMALVNPAVGVLFIVQTMTHSSATFCRRIADSPLLPVLHKVLTDSREDVLNPSRNQELRKLVELCVCVVYNAVKHEELDLVDTMHSAGLVTAMQPYLNAPDQRVRMFVLMFFAYVVNEAEAEAYCSDDESLSLIINHLSMAMNNKNKHSNGHHSLELLRVLAKLSALDMKTRLGRLGVLVLMRSVVATGTREEVEEAVRVIWHLAYDSHNAESIQKDKLDSLILTRATDYRSSKLKRTSINIKKTADKSTIKTVELIREESCRVGGERTSVGDVEWWRADVVKDGSREQVDGGCSSKTRPQPCAPHIMISYSWVNKKTVLQIKDEIVRAGYKVWIDEVNMRGNVLDAMSAAVENSWLFLACSSRSYKSSENCRMELEFAHERKKRICYLIMDNFEPDGWLGLLIRKNFYYDFFKEPFEETMVKLLSDVRAWMPDSAGKAKEEEVAVAEMSAVCAALDRCNSSKSDDDLPSLSYLNDWTSDDVKKWCVANDIEWTEEMAAVTGEDLHFMAEMQRTTRDCFFRTIEKLKFKTVNDMTKFDKALKKL